MTLVWRPGYTWWDPSLISTALWLDAADASTITTVSGAVSQWNDKSGNNRHVAQSDSAKRPTVSSASINSKNTLLFDGSNDFLVSTGASLPVGASSRSMFVVYKPGATSGTFAICGQSGASVSNQWFLLQFRNQGAVGDPYFAGYSQDLTNGSAITTATKIAGVTYNGTQGTLYQNGSQIAQSALTLNTVSSEFLVGASANGVQEFVNGLIAEIVFLASAASTDTRQRIEGYLAHKWGLTANLPSNHPYKTNAPAP
jgi:hypothetical protein